MTLTTTCKNGARILLSLVAMALLAVTFSRKCGAEIPASVLQAMFEAGPGVWVSTGCEPQGELFARGCSGGFVLRSGADEALGLISGQPSKCGHDVAKIASYGLLPDRQFQMLNGYGNPLMIQGASSQIGPHELSGTSETVGTIPAGQLSSSNIARIALARAQSFDEARQLLKLAGSSDLGEIPLTSRGGVYISRLRSILDGVILQDGVVVNERDIEAGIRALGKEFAEQSVFDIKSRPVSSNPPCPRWRGGFIALPLPNQPSPQYIRQISFTGVVLAQSTSLNGARAFNSAQNFNMQYGGAPMFALSLFPNAVNCVTASSFPNESNRPNDQPLSRAENPFAHDEPGLVSYLTGRGETLSNVCGNLVFITTGCKTHDPNEATQWWDLTSTAFDMLPGTWW